MNQLDGDVPVEALVMSAQHHAHAALPERLDDTVGAVDDAPRLRLVLAERLSDGGPTPARTVGSV